MYQTYSIVCKVDNNIHTRTQFDNRMFDPEIEIMKTAVPYYPTFFAHIFFHYEGIIFAHFFRLPSSNNIKIGQQTKYKGCIVMSQITPPENLMG